jgi:NAD(P)H-hydrate repair Nnr-like enzyme with NAD(P)H-hydrate dehydratase domain
MIEPDKEKALSALNNILSRPDDVVTGNGVSMGDHFGALYDDVFEGLIHALALCDADAFNVEDQLKLLEKRRETVGIIE